MRFLTGSAALKNDSAFWNYNILIIRERNLSRLVQCIYKMAQKNCSTSFFGQIESYFWTKKQIRPKFANGSPNSFWSNPAIHLGPQNNYWELRCEIYQIFWLYRPLLNIHKIEKSRLNGCNILGLYGFFWHANRVETGPISYCWCIQFFVKK